MRNLVLPSRVLQLAALLSLFGSGVAIASPPSIAIVDCADSSYAYTLLGQHVKMFVKISSDEPLGRAEIRVEYTFPGLTFLGASAVSDLAQWEFFTWRHLPDTTYPDSGASAIQLTAVADLDNGADVHPDPAALIPSGPVIQLNFWVTSDRNLVNSCPPISIDEAICGQMALQSANGQVVYVAPGSDGSCYSASGKTVLDNMSFANGSVCIVELDSRGDINLDGVVYNIGDAVLFNRRFVYGPVVWDSIWGDVQALESDMNDDGIPETVDDFHFLIKVLTNNSMYPANVGPCW